MPIPRLRPRPLAVALAASLAALAPSFASAQSLIQLYDAAHAYDAPISRRARNTSRRPLPRATDSALLRPYVSLGANAGAGQGLPGNNESPSNSSYGVTVTGRQTRSSTSRAARPSRSRSVRWCRRSPISSAEQDLMLRVARPTSTCSARRTRSPRRASKKRDRRAARLGQAQLRGRHRHHHRHARGAGALRPRDRAGDRGRERPAHQAHRARPASRPQRRRRRQLAVPVALPRAARPASTTVSTPPKPSRVRRAAARVRHRAARDEQGAAGQLPTVDARRPRSGTRAQPAAWRVPGTAPHRHDRRAD
jgi:hypothetical protein